MKTSSLIRMAAAAMVVLAIGIASARGQGEDPRAPRLWRATTGQTLKAAFVEIKAGAVVLKAEDGQLRGVPLNLLMPKDQAVAKDFAERMGAGGMFAVKPALPGRLPTFAEGPGKGFYAFYTNANFIVRVTDKEAVLPYGDIPKGFKGAMKSAEIKGPVFGSRRLSLAPGRSKNAEMEFYSAGHGALFSGYNIRLVKKNAASKDDAERITLKIE
jgi:hypothetical protein